MLIEPEIIGDEIVSRVRAALSRPEGSLELHEPSIGETEERRVVDCLRSGWLSTAGPYTLEFETNLEDIVGGGHVVAMMNGSAALHMALIVSGVEPGDEVLAPALTFVATANAVIYCGAVPHFIEAEEETFGVDPAKLSEYLASVGQSANGTLTNRKTGRRIAALVVTHILGVPAEIIALKDIANRYGIPLIEDAAEGLGSTLQGKHVGRFGKISALSFNGNKIISTGAGGAILTEDKSLAERCRYLSTTAKEPHPWDFNHTESGFNYRMPNLNAALGLAQLDRFSDILSAKRKIALQYAQYFAGYEAAPFVETPDLREINCWLNAIRLSRAGDGQIAGVLNRMHELGVRARPLWRLMPDLAPFTDCPTMDVGCARGIVQSVITLPSGPDLILT